MEYPRHHSEEKVAAKRDDMLAALDDLQAEPPIELSDYDAMLLIGGFISNANRRTTHPSQKELLEANDVLFSSPNAIPLRNRLRYLVGDENEKEKNGYRFVELDELTVKTGASIRTLQKLLTELRIPSEMIRIDELGHMAVILGIDKVLVEEFEWRKMYISQPEYMPIGTIARLIGLDVRYIKQHLDQVGIASRAVDKSFLYPKSILYMFRVEKMDFPPARNNRPIAAIEESTGYGRKKIIRRAEELEVEPDLMRTEYGHVVQHYPEKLDEILSAEHDAVRKVQKERTLRNVTQIARDLDRDEAWVYARITRFARYAQPQLLNGLTYKAYDNDVFEVLEQESNDQRQIPFLSEDLMTLDDMVRPIGSTQETAGPILQELGIQPIIRRSRYNGKIVKAYDSGVQLTLAHAILESKKQRLEDLESTIATLSMRPTDELNPELKKKLSTARRLRYPAQLLFDRARQAYERFLNDPQFTSDIDA